MDSWRGGKKGYDYTQQGSWRRSKTRKPPRGSWQPTVPSWEKAFCKEVGLLDWDNILDMKKFVHLFDNVVNWNDSAGEEAFHNAKNRFWAKKQGLPCDLSLPDPNLYIDEIDWDSKIDPELLLDLECRTAVPDADGKHEAVIIFGDSLIANEAFSPAGWGEDEDKVKRDTNSTSHNNDNLWEHLYGESNGTRKENGWGHLGNDQWCYNGGGEHLGDTGWQCDWENSQAWCNPGVETPTQGGGWDSSGGWGDTGWQGDWENSGSCGQPGVADIRWRNAKDYSWGWQNPDNYRAGSENFKDRRAGSDRGWGSWGVGVEKRDNISRDMPRYTTSGFHDFPHGTNSWGNRKGRKRGTFVRDQSRTNERTTSREWNLVDACVPVIHHASGVSGQAWSWEKPVSRAW